MYSIVSTASVHGVLSMMVQAEADVCNGMPSFDMVGVLSSEVREAKERIRAAIRNAGFLLPPKKITVNLRPADLKKNGTGFDLPIALAVLSACGMIKREKMQRTLFVGEIALSGELRPVRGILPMTLAAKEHGFAQIMIPKENAMEAGFVKGIDILPAASLMEVIDYLNGCKKPRTDNINIERTQVQTETAADFSGINGQHILRRACEVAAAGMHNILMIGPPGAGKTLAASAMPTILPELKEDEMLELAGIYSVSGLFEQRRTKLYERPFRSPHHSITKTALLGGGRIPLPGEISLAHKGILFLDELTEFEKPVLEQLRQPLEDKHVRLVRSSGTYCYPADFMLVAAMNPCDCGYYPDKNKCVCTPGNVKRHLQKISRPLLDRIDLTVEVPKVKMTELSGSRSNETSARIRERVLGAHNVQKQRFLKEVFHYNSRMPAEKIKKYCPMEPKAEEQIKRAYEEMDLSARAYYRLIRVARTIADLEESDQIKENHMMEALLYRSAEGALWRRGL